jgi:hypothetical protein
MKRHSFVPLFLLALAAFGCQGLHQRPLNGSGMDLFAPVALRLHPLTRILPDQLEARVELMDQMDDVTKGVGLVRLELYRYELTSLNHRGPLIGRWQTDLATLEVNGKYWDAITRTYVFRYPLDARQTRDAGRFVLVATMQFPNNSELTNQLTLSLK